MTSLLALTPLWLAVFSSFTCTLIDRLFTEINLQLKSCDYGFLGLWQAPQKIFRQGRHRPHKLDVVSSENKVSEYSTILLWQGRYTSKSAETLRRLGKVDVKLQTEKRTDRTKWPSPEANKNPLAERKEICIPSRCASRCTTREVGTKNWRRWLRSSYGLGPKIGGLRLLDDSTMTQSWFGKEPSG